MITTTFKVYADDIATARVRARPIIARQLVIDESDVDTSRMHIEIHNEIYSPTRGFANSVATITYTEP